MDRKVIERVKGRAAVDGAGVHMTRVLSRGNVRDFDPFLMLDSFDSKDPDDYMAGFPMHPHRGIETLTYLLKGEMAHKDSMGNAGLIRSGEAQWMTAGSGILHEEMPRASEHLLGFQLWINLPQKDKMTRPHYQALTEDEIAVHRGEAADVRVLSGQYKDAKGFRPLYVQARILDVDLKEDGAAFGLKTPEENTLFLFTLLGSIEIDGTVYEEKTAVLTGPGEGLQIKAAGGPARVIFYDAPRLDEALAWGGPIVMNTRSELKQAFEDLSSGEFIKDEI